MALPHAYSARPPSVALFPERRRQVLVDVSERAHVSLVEPVTRYARPRRAKPYGSRAASTSSPYRLHTMSVNLLRHVGMLFSDLLARQLGRNKRYWGLVGQTSAIRSGPGHGKVTGLCRFVTSCAPLLPFVRLLTASAADGLRRGGIRVSQPSRDPSGSRGPFLSLDALPAPAQARCWISVRCFSGTA